MRVYFQCDQKHIFLLILNAYALEAWGRPYMKSPKKDSSYPPPPETSLSFTDGLYYKSLRNKIDSSQFSPPVVASFINGHLGLKRIRLYRNTITSRYCTTKCLKDSASDTSSHLCSVKHAGQRPFQYYLLRFDILQ